MSYKYSPQGYEPRARSVESPILRPELEAKVQKILSKIPQHILDDVNKRRSELNPTSPQQKYNQFLNTFSGTSFRDNIQSSWHRRTASAQRGEAEISTPIRTIPDKITCNFCWPEDSKPFPLTEPSQLRDSSHFRESSRLQEPSPLRERSEALKLKVDEAIIKAQKLAKTATNTSAHKTFIFPSRDSGINYQDINHRMVEAIQRSQDNLKKSGEYRSYASTNSSLAATGSNFNKGYHSPKRSTIEDWRSSSAGFENRILSSNKKVESPKRSTYQLNQYSYTVGTSSIDLKFDEVMRRSQALRKVNDSMVGRTHFLSGVFQKETELVIDNRYSTPYAFKAVDRTGGFEAREVRAFESPLRGENGLHIFQNAVRNLSPPRNVENVDENYADGTSYKGEMVRGRKHGKGVLVYKDGSKYDGDWQNDMCNGFGIKTMADGEVEYAGEWVANSYQGNGYLNNPKPRDLGKDGFDYQNFDELKEGWTKYQGEFASGKWHGIGTLNLTNGEKFVGKFRNGKLNGTGTFYQKGDSSVTGEWRDNKFFMAL